MTTDAAPALDAEALNRTVGLLVGDFSSSLAGALIYIGDRNGLWAALDGAGWITPEELAHTTGQAPRYLKEWLSAMTCAGYVNYDPATGRFSLPAESAFCLANSDSPAFFQRTRAVRR